MPDNHDQQPKKLIALVLAGRRSSGPDPMGALDVSHKAFIEIGGVTLIDRVLATLEECDRVSEVWIAAPKDVRAEIEQRGLARDGVSFVASLASPSLTLQAVLEAAPEDTGLLMTTCDHPLLQLSMIEEFLRAVDEGECDIASACVTQQQYLQAFPDSKRTYIKFRDFQFTGANLFWLNPHRAVPLVRFWRRLEDNRKNPVRMAWEIGPLTAIQYLLGRLTKGGAMKRLAAITGVRAHLAPLSQAEAAIDVDKPEDIELVQRLIAARGG